MNINIYDEMKKAIKDALTEWYNENKSIITGTYEKTEDGNTLLTVKQFCEKHPFVTEGSLRFRCSNKEYNKFQTCLSKVGRKVLIKEKEALEYFSNPPKEANWTYDKTKWGAK